MRDDWELLLDEEAPSDARRGALGSVLAGGEAAERLEAALPDLLARPDEALLLELVRGLAPRAVEDGPARRVLELLSRRPGPTRAPALAALRGPG